MATEAPLAVSACGMVTGVGLDTASSCAAMRAAIDNFSETRFLDDGGERIVGSEVCFAEPARGLQKLTKMLAASIAECLNQIRDVDTKTIPLLLCVAEHDRPGRLAAIDDRLFPSLEAELGVRFAKTSATVARGKVAGAVALHLARKRIADDEAKAVLIAGVDSFLQAGTIAGYQRREQLMTSSNSNGFIPGEAAAAILVTPIRKTEEPQLICVGMGFDVEKSTLDSGKPLRADGLTAAVKASLQDAGCQLHELDFRISDLSGEQYYFKEASLAVSRAMKTTKPEFDIWHPADTIGEVGAAIGPVALIVALAANRKGYSLGNNVLCHFSDDNGTRAALVLTYRAVGTK